MRDDKFSGLNIELEPKLGEGAGFEKVFKAIRRDLREKDSYPYGWIFYLVNMDTVIRQRKQDLYCEMKDKLLKMPESRDKVFIIESKPCLEFWFLLHYVQSNRLYQGCDEVIL